MQYFSPIILNSTIMRFDILTLFPEAFTSFLSTSIMGRAISEKKIEVQLINIRDFAENKHKKVDDIPYGGGAGMVLMPQPIFDCVAHVKALKKDKAPLIYLTPHGETFQQEIAEELSQKEERIMLLCGHYEGIDQRVRTALVDREISIGDFVVTGGELPAQLMIDAIARLCPAVLGRKESHQEESFSEKLERKCEYPHYTRPAEFLGMPVPEVLLSGHHANIEAWRKEHCVKKD